MTSNITPKTSKSWLSDKEEVAFIDVIEIGQHTSGHPFFSISIQYSLFELKIETLVPNKKTRVILIDNNDGISKLAYNVAHKLGYSNIFIIAVVGVPSYLRLDKRSSSMAKTTSPFFKRHTLALCPRVMPAIQISLLFVIKFCPQYL